MLALAAGFGLGVLRMFFDDLSLFLLLSLSWSLVVVIETAPGQGDLDLVELSGAQQRAGVLCRTSMRFGVERGLSGSGHVCLNGLAGDGRVSGSNEDQTC